MSLTIIIYDKGAIGDSVFQWPPLSRCAPLAHRNARYQCALAERSRGPHPWPIGPAPKANKLWVPPEPRQQQERSALLITVISAADGPYTGQSSFLKALGLNVL